MAEGLQTCHCVQPQTSWLCKMRRFRKPTQLGHSLGLRYQKLVTNTLQSLKTTCHKTATVHLACMFEKGMNPKQPKVHGIHDMSSVVSLACFQTHGCFAMKGNVDLQHKCIIAVGCTEEQINKGKK